MANEHSSIYVTKVGHHFESHMTPAKFYVSSDALVHLKVSIEYLSKNCRTVGWMPCSTTISKQSRSKYNMQRQRQREG